MSREDLKGRQQLIEDLRFIRDRNRHCAANGAIARNRQEELEKLTALLDDILDAFDCVGEAA